MTDNGPKRIAIRICTPDVIELIDLLPRGFKSLVVESALAAYLNSDTGKMLIEQLIHRKNHQQKPTKTLSSKKEVVFSHLKGDFN